MMKENFTNEQLAEVFGEKKEAELDPELEKVAENVIDCYDFDPEKESFLVLTDTTVMQKNPDFLVAIERQLEQRTGKNPRTKGNYEILTVPSSEHSATAFGKYIGDKMKNRPVLIATSMSRSHSPETAAAFYGRISTKDKFDAILHSDNSPATLESLAQDPDYYEKLQELAKKTRSRVISMTKAHNPFQILTRGAVEESLDTLREKADKVNELLKDVEDVHISTENGTDLVVKIRYDKSDIEDGRINQPGKVSNYPIGEWSCSVRLEGTSGDLVVDIAAGGNHNKDQFDENGPIKLGIKDGVVFSINGFDLAELKELLGRETDYKLLDENDSSSKEYKAERQRIQDLVDKYFDDKGIDNPLIRSMLKYWVYGDNKQHHCFRLAEFAIGTNTKACRGKDPKDIGSSEGEKIYGTFHIAVGSNGSFGVKHNDPNFNDCQIHCDMVIGGSTIKCAKKDGSKFNLIEKGNPVGY